MITIWITTTGGFYSAVQYKDDVSMLSVRTRDRESAQIAVDALEARSGKTYDILENVGTDYPYRFYVSKDVFSEWVAYEIREYVTYGNFKSAVAESRGSKWSSALMRVWSAMHAVTDASKQDDGYYGQVMGTGRTTHPHSRDYSEV